MRLWEVNRFLCTIPWISASIPLYHYQFYYTFAQVLFCLLWQPTICKIKCYRGNQYKRIPGGNIQQRAVCVFCKHTLEVSKQRLYMQECFWHAAS